ncbi:MAG TPA: hypothetical protein VJR58_30180, partial [Vineibacter sp.]|nr:hypothetical protein [Vineibacter sp.]
LVLDARSALIGQYLAANGNVGKQAVEDPSPANVPENAIPLMDEIRRVKRAKDLVPEIGKQASSGLRVLAAIDAGKSEVFRQLVQKHFVPLTAVNSRQDLHRSDYDYIKSTLTAIQRQTLARAKRSDGGWRSLNKGNFGHSGDDIWSAWAETKIGAGGSLDAADPDPRSFIWLSPRLDYLADDRIFARILLHELVHYVGKSSGPDAHVDSAYLQDAGQAYSCEGATCHKADYAELATWQRIRNPDCYACFCLEATYGTDVLKSWRDQPQGEFDRPPIVKSGFGNAP